LASPTSMLTSCCQSSAYHSLQHRIQHQQRHCRQHYSCPPPHPLSSVVVVVVAPSPSLRSAAVICASIDRTSLRTFLDTVEHPSSFYPSSHSFVSADTHYRTPDATTSIHNHARSLQTVIITAKHANSASADAAARKGPYGWSCCALSAQPCAW